MNNHVLLSYMLNAWVDAVLEINGGLCKCVLSQVSRLLSDMNYNEIIYD